MYLTNVWYKRHYLVPLHGVSTAVLPLLKFQPSYDTESTELSNGEQEVEPTHRI